MKYTFSIKNDTKNGKLNSPKLFSEFNNSSVKKVINGFTINGDELIIETISELTTGEISVVNAIINNHNGEELEFEVIKKKYFKYRTDGLDYSDSWRATKVMEFYAGTYSEEDIYTIEAAVHEVMCDIIKGNWMTAEHHISSIEKTELITQELIDEISTDITNYISNNY